MTVLFASTAASASRTGLVRTDNEDAAFAAAGCSPPRNGTGGRSQLRMRVRATDGNAQVPSSAAWHRCLTVQLSA